MTIEGDAGTGAATDAGTEGAGSGQEQGTTLLTRPDDPGHGSGTEQGEEGKQAGEQEAGKDDPADKVPDKPEGYDLKFAETTQVDQELLTEFQKKAHALGLSKDRAQKLASMYEAHSAKVIEKAQADYQQAVKAQIKKWEDEITSSPTFEQDKSHARTALREFGDKELSDLMDSSNLGSHPRMWAFMAKVGKALAEPGFKGESAGRGDKTAAEIMYPNQGKQ